MKIVLSPNPDLLCAAALSRAASILVSLVVLVAPSTALAAAIYQYVGRPFTSAAAPYTTSDFIRGTVTLAAPLPANRGRSAVAAIDFEFTDGHSVYAPEGVWLPGDLAPTPFTSTSIDLGTSSSGEINQWVVKLSVIIVAEVYSSRLDPFGFDIAALPGGIEAENNRMPGTWTLIPEPGTSVLVSAGLLGLRVARSRR